MTLKGFGQHFALSKISEQPLKYFLSVSILIIAFAKLMLAGKGFMSNSDELRYVYAGYALHDFIAHKYHDGVVWIFSTHGRPGDTVIKIFVNWLQYKASRVLNLNYYDSGTTYPLFIFNYLVGCGIIFFLYKISKLLLKSSALALLSVLLFSTLTNSFIYLRHALPYDESLLIFTCILYFVIKNTGENKLRFRVSFIMGFWGFFGYLVYPGYFVIYFVVFLMLLLNNLTKENFTNRIYCSALFGFGSAICLLLFEMVSRLAGKSYLASASQLSKTITLGSFEECYSFIVKYLLNVEGISGCLLLVGFALFAVILLRRVPNKKQGSTRAIYLLFGLSTLVYLGYASMGYFFHTMVFYGRLLHPFILYMCIFSVYSVNELLSRIPDRQKEVFLFVISIFFITQFYFHFTTYLTYVYPQDLGWELRKKYSWNNIENVFEYRCDSCYTAVPSETLVGKERYPASLDTTKHRITAVNFTDYGESLDDIRRYHPYEPKPGDSLIFSAVYPKNFIAYQYEGVNIQGRENLVKMKLRLKVYRDK